MKTLVKSVVAATVALASVATTASAWSVQPSWKSKSNYSAAQGIAPASITIRNEGWFNVIAKDGGHDYITSNDRGIKSIPKDTTEVFRLNSDTAEVTWYIECAGQNYQRANVKQLRPHVLAAGYHNGDFKGSADDDIIIYINGTCFGHGQTARQGGWQERPKTW